MMTAETLSERIARLPDNIRAEIARRHTTIEIVVEQMTDCSRATFMRRMRRPGKFTIGNIVDLARILNVRPSVLLDWNGER